MPECRHCDEPATLMMDFENGDRVPVCARHEVYEADTRKRAGAPFKYSREPLSAKIASGIAGRWWGSREGGTAHFMTGDRRTACGRLIDPTVEEPPSELRCGRCSLVSAGGWNPLYQPNRYDQGPHPYGQHQQKLWRGSAKLSMSLNPEAFAQYPKQISGDYEWLDIPRGSVLTLQVLPLSLLEYSGFYSGGDDRTPDEWQSIHDGIEQRQNMPPLIVSKMPDGRYKVEDGNHRLEKANELGLTEFPAYVYDPRAQMAKVTTIRRSEFHFGAGPDIEAWFETARQHGKPAVFQLIKPVSLEVRGGKIPIPGAEPIGESQDGLPIYRTLDLGWHPELQQRVNADYGPNGAPEQRDQYADLQPGRRGIVTDVEPMLKMLHVQIPLNDVGRLHPHQATGWLSYTDVLPLTGAGDPFVKQQR